MSSAVRGISMPIEDWLALDQLVAARKNSGERVNLSSLVRSLIEPSLSGVSA